MSIKKYALVIIVIFIVVLGPVFMMSDWGMGVIQGIVDKNPKSDSAPWLQFTLGKVYYYTMRPEGGVDAMSKYIERYPEPKDRRYWDARYFRALSLGEAKRSRDAANAFWEYLDQCPKDDPNRNEVRKETLSYRSYLQDFPIPD